MGKRKLDSPEDHRIVTPAEWLAARAALLEKEKAFSRQREDLAR